MKIPGYDSGFTKLEKSKLKDVTSEPNAAKKKGEKSGSISNNSEASTVNVSSKGREIQRASEIAKFAPVVRSEKIDEIAKKIESGTYFVDSNQIAEKMLEDILTG